MNNSDEVRILQLDRHNCTLAQFSLHLPTNQFGGQMQDGIQEMPLF